MPGTGALTYSGLLYEGNFEEWFRRVKAILVCNHSSSKKLTDLEIVFGPDYSRSRFRLARYTRRARLNEGNQFVDELSTIIWWQVSPSVRSRIKQQDRETPVRLMEALYATAQPFRFMDLPGEARLRVYPYVMQSRTEIVPLGFSDHVKRGPEPPITRVSRRLRAETMPFFHKSQQPILYLHGINIRPRRTFVPNRMQGLSYSGISVATAINDWARTLSKDRLKYLRKILVHLPYAATKNWALHGKPLAISIVTAKGTTELRVAENIFLESASQQRLTDHAASISKLAQALRLEGEAIIMFLTSQPTIWDQLEFKSD